MGASGRPGFLWRSTSSSGPSYSVQAPKFTGEVVGIQSFPTIELTLKASQRGLKQRKTLIFIFSVR